MLPNSNFITRESCGWVETRVIHSTQTFITQFAFPLASVAHKLVVYRRHCRSTQYFVRRRYIDICLPTAASPTIYRLFSVAIHI